MTHLFYLLLILSEYLINDNGDGAIAGYIAGGTETVHRNIEGYHKRLHIGNDTGYDFLEFLKYVLHGAAF